MNKIGIVLAGISVFALAACEMDDETVSTLGGAAIGAGVGMAVSSDADKEEGALIGAGLGAIIGNSLANQRAGRGNQQATGTQQASTQTATPRYDQSRYDGILSAHNFALQTALENNAPERWRYQGASGTVYPTNSWVEYGLRCRGFDSVWNDGGQTGTESGSACRQPNGFWKQN